MKKTLLYVEDEADDIFFMEEAVRRTGIPVELHSVADGRKAIDYLGDPARQPLPAAILLDLNLPLMSGLEVLQWIREHPRLRNLPVLIFSSSGYQKDRDQARRLGANDYLLKPSSGLEFSELVRKIYDQWLDPATPAAS